MKLLHNTQSLGFKLLKPLFFFFFHISSDIWKEVKVQFNPRGSEFIELIFFFFLVLAKKTEIELNIIMKKIKTGREKAEGGTCKILEVQGEAGPEGEQVC